MAYISRLTQKIKTRLGITPKPTTADLLTIQFLKLLQERDYSPRCILDIGANHGQWTDRCLQVFPKADYILFEPQKRVFAELEEKYNNNHNITLINAGAGSKTEEREIWINPERDDSASFIREVCQSASVERITSAETAQIIKIDDWISESGHKPNIIKIDAEGLDLEVISGAEEAILRASIIFAEAGILNTKSTSFGELITRMSSLGFALVDFTDLNRTRKTSALWLVEAAFAKRDSFIFKEIRSYLD